MINVVFSSHRINDAEVCPRLYYYKHELLKGPLKQPTYFEEGELLHYIFKLYYSDRMEKKDPNYELYYERGRNFATKLSITSELVEETIEAAKMYFEFYPPQYETWEILGVEVPFARLLFENDQIRIIVTGTNDLIVRTNNGKGPVVIVDHKYLAQFRPMGDRANQPLTYCWATGIRDFLYNKIGKQKSYKPEQRLKREPYLNYGEHHIEEWRNSAIYAAMELVRCNETGVWPARFSSCRYQGKKCTFYDICNTTPSNRDYKLNTFFRDVTPYDIELMERG